MVSKIMATGSNLAKSAGDDLMGQFSGTPGHDKKGMGWRMAERMNAHREGLDISNSTGPSSESGGNIIGPASPDAPSQQTQQPQSTYISPLNNYGEDG